MTYSDTGIYLRDTSDIYAVDAAGNPDDSGNHPTAISAGGTWIPTMPGSYAEVGRFTMNATANLAAPGHTVQSLGIKANGSVSVGGTVYNTSTPGNQIPVLPATAKFTDVAIAPRTVGFLSDYFDQKAQASLADEAQAGATPAAAPAAPSSWTSTGFTAITNVNPTRVLDTLQSTTSTTTYTAGTDLILPRRSTAATSRSPAAPIRPAARSTSRICTSPATSPSPGPGHGQHVSLRRRHDHDQQRPPRP